MIWIALSIAYVALASLVLFFLNVDLHPPKSQQEEAELTALAALAALT